jgi:hypothetical protein
LATDDGWRIGLEAVPYHVRPRWPDPAYPQQGHFDLRVRDLNGATERAIELGATRLGGDGMWHTLADPAGHPFDLCRSANEADMTIHAITIDAPNASALAPSTPNCSVCQLVTRATMGYCSVATSIAG